MPSLNHSFAQTNLAILIGSAYRKKYSIFTELSLELHSGKANPDLAIYEKKKPDWRHDTIRETEPPLTVVEILSPRQSFQEVADKIAEIYFPAGVKSAWLVVPTVKTIHIFTPDDEVATFTKGKLTDPAIGVELEMAEIFD